MKILFKDTFISRLEKQIDFIALENPGNARKFKSEMLSRIKEIPSNPYRCLKQSYANLSFVGK
jgi:hypothetical protein